MASTTPSNVLPETLKYKSSAQPVKSKFDLKVPISYPGAILKYSVGTEAYDIDFSLVFESEFDGEETVLIETTKISSDEPLIGEYVFKSAKGLAVFKFDNTYSWWRTKTLSYNVNLIPPDVDKMRDLRVNETRHKLLNGTEDVVRAERRRRRTQVAAHELKEKLDHLQNEMAMLQKEITAKSRSFMEIEQESSWIENRIRKQRQQNIPTLIVELVQNGGWILPPQQLQKETEAKIKEMGTESNAESDSDNL